MKEQPYALRLAEDLDEASDPLSVDAADELRRLHSLNAELVEALETIQSASACVYSKNIAEAAIAKAGEQQ